MNTCDIIQSYTFKISAELANLPNISAKFKNVDAK